MTQRQLPFGETKSNQPSATSGYSRADTSQPTERGKIVSHIILTIVDWWFTRLSSSGGVNMREVDILRDVCDKAAQKIESAGLNELATFRASLHNLCVGMSTSDFGVLSAIAGHKNAVGVPADAGKTKLDPNFLGKAFAEMNEILAAAGKGTYALSNSNRDFFELTQQRAEFLRNQVRQHWSTLFPQGLPTSIIHRTHDEADGKWTVCFKAGPECNRISCSFGVDSVADANRVFKHYVSEGKVYPLKALGVNSSSHHADWLYHNTGQQHSVYEVSVQAPDGNTMITDAPKAKFTIRDLLFVPPKFHSDPGETEFLIRGKTNDRPWMRREDGQRIA